MTRRLVAVSLWVIASVTVLAVLMIGLLVWRLASGPVPVGFVLPYITSWFVDGLPPQHVEVQEAFLAWEAETDRLTLWASGVRLVSEAGIPLARCQGAVVSFSRQALMRGQLAPTALTVEHADIRLTRQPDGTLYLGSGSTPQERFVIRSAEPAGAKNLWHILTQVADTLMFTPQPSQPLAALRDIRLHDSVLSVTDQRLGLTWHATHTDVTFQRDQSGLTGRLAVVARVHDRATTMELHLSSTAPLQQLKVDLAFTDLLPPMLATVVPTLQSLANFDVPFTGTLNAILRPQGALPTINFALRGAPGAAGPIFALSGTADELEGDLAVRGRVTLEALPIADLNKYWPQNVSSKARAWLVENLVAGTVPQGHMNIRLRLRPGDAKVVHVEHLDGSLQYHGCEVHYLRPLPPLRQAQGRATFDQQGWLIHVDSARGEHLRVTHGTVEITGLDRRRDAIAIRVGIDTPVRAALTLLDHPRLNLLAQWPIEPAATNGQATLEAVFAFPLRGRVTIDQVDIQAQGTLTDVAIQSVILGQTAERGQLKLRFDRKALHLAGTINVAAIPLSLEWTETFGAQATWKSQIEIAVPRLNTTHLARLGLDLHGVVQGALATTLTVQLGQQGRGQIHTKVQLQDATLVLPWWGWHKPAGEPGEASALLRLAAGGLVGLDHLRLQAGTLRTHGTAQFGQPGTTLVRMALHDLTLGNSHLKEVALRRQDAGYSITIGEGTLDVQPLLRSQKASEQRATPLSHSTVTSGGPGGAAQAKAFPVQVYAPRLQRLSFGSEHYLQEVEAVLIRSTKGWERIELTGSIPTALVRHTKADTKAIQQGQQPRSRTIVLRYRPSSTGTYELSVETKDVGSTLRALNLSDDIIGGSLGIAGNTVSPQPGALLQGTIDMRQFRIHDAPVLAHILAAVSLTGLGDVLGGDGLHFARLFGDFTLHDGVVTTKHLRAYGRALGLTTQGTLNIGAGTLDLQGTVAPFNEINRFLDKIPVLGDILVGSKGQGIIAVNYHLTGPIGSPKVTVNPASVLTPGFLRDIVEVLKETENNQTEPPAPDN